MKPKKRERVIKAWAVLIPLNNYQITASRVYEELDVLEQDWSDEIADKVAKVIRVEIRPVRKKK